MATPSPYNYSKNTNSASDLDPTKKKPAGAGASVTTGGGAQPPAPTPTPASPAGTASGQTGQQQMYPGAVDPEMKGGMMRTANGSTIGQSPMNPSAQYISTPKQTFNYATSPGTGNADFGEVLHPKLLAEIGMKNFGDNNLANRAARPVGRSMSDPQRQAEMARRNAVANGDVSGAARMTMGQQPQQVAGGGGQTPNGSTIRQSPMNPSMNLSAGQSNTPSQTLNYATRPGIGKTNFDEVNKPTPETFGQNNLANRAARPVGRSMSDPQRQAEMARRNAVANGGMSGEGEDEEMPPGRAKGGPVKAGRPYLVGEEGPEIIVPTHGGHVVPNHAISMAELMEMKRAGRKIVLPKGAVGAKFFETRPVPQKKACGGMKRGRC
ncbi:MAG: hypothetical protein ACYC67_23930 [Prosthecobacter sp.]